MRDHIAEGFDYKKLRKLIDNNYLLTHAQRDQAKNLFAPDGDYRAFIEYMAGLSHFRPPGLTLEEFKKDNVHTLWKEAWGEVHAYFSAKIPAYLEATEADREQIRQIQHMDLHLSPLEKEFYQSVLEYPNRAPPLELCFCVGKIEHPDLPAASMSTLNMFTNINEAFLRMPKALQKAVFLHEAVHFFEAMNAGLLPADYVIRDRKRPEFRRRAIWKQHELNADAVASIIGVNEDYAAWAEFIRFREKIKADILDRVSEEEKQTLSLIMDAQHAGFKLKNPVLPKEIREKEAWNMQQAIENALSAALIAAKCGNKDYHPSPEERINNILTVSYAEMLKREPYGTILGRAPLPSKGR